MPAHIGFMDILKQGVGALNTNLSPGSDARRARSALASQRRNLRGQQQGLDLGVPDPVHQFGDRFLSISDVQQRAETNRSRRERRCDSYEAYRSYLDARSPYLVRGRDAANHGEYINKTEWDLYLDEGTWFDVVVHTLFLVPNDNFYAMLIVRKSNVYQLKRIEGINQHGTAIMWSFDDSCHFPAMPPGQFGQAAE